MTRIYRVVLETETPPREPTVSLDRVPSIQVDAPSVEIAGRMALAEHIDNRPAPPPAGTSFTLVVITPANDDSATLHHDLDAEAEMTHLDLAYWPTKPAIH